MQFQVPQFIETETKIVGPFTLSQFLYLATAGIIVFILQFAITNLTVLIIISLPIILLAAALAFYKVDGIPFPKYLMMALSFMTGPKRYQFTKDENQEYLNKH